MILCHNSVPLRRSSVEDSLELGFTENVHDLDDEFKVCS